jgi:hypothetical protein
MLPILLNQRPDIVESRTFVQARRPGYLNMRTRYRMLIEVSFAFCKGAAVKCEY